MKASGTHFPGLDVIRAFACLSVFVAHMFDYINNRTLSGAESWLYDGFISGAGAMGVSLFFVLSGFLITYLLIREKAARQSIHIGFFYMKRILRIWPLFFLVTIAGFFIVPLVSGGIDSNVIKAHLPWYLTFTNNFDRIFSGFTGGDNDILGVRWSVAVEEQFYLLWPLLVLFTPSRFFPFLSIAVIGFSAAFRFMNAGHADVLLYHSLSVSGDLATGGLAAWLAFNSDRFRNLFVQMKQTTRYVLLLVAAVVIFNHHYFLQADIYSVPGRLFLVICFAWIICDQALSRKKLNENSGWKYLTRIGIISYGFYCYHMFVIMLLQKINVIAGFTTINAGIFYTELAAAFILTLAIAEISFRYFEKQFMKYRAKFDIMSQPAASTNTVS